MTLGLLEPKERPSASAGSRMKTVTITVVALVIITTGLHALWAIAYEGRIYPGVSLSRIPLGGLTREEARLNLEERFSRVLADGIVIVVDGVSKRISLDDIAENDPDLSRTLINVDISEAVERAYAHGRSPNPILNLFLAFLPSVERPRLTLPVTIDHDSMAERFFSAFPEYDVEPAPTAFLIEKESETWRIAIMEGQERTTLALEAPLTFLELGFSQLNEVALATPVELPIVTLKPEVRLEEAALLIPEAEATLTAAPFTLVYEDEYGRETSWDLSDEDLAAMLIPAKRGLELDEEMLRSFFEPVQTVVNVEARDAHFTFSGTRADVFVPSRNGQEVDLENSMARLRESILARTNEPVTLVVHETEPDVALSEANDLGIKELLGTGVSDYSGSPGNRIKNIRNGVRLLNGILIPPGETFSLLKALAPFTTENGYLPELVIKGDKIIPEIGGGLCQIGSTTFRATMNAGLEVVERRNHSLVVSYYNDPSNGNPGTDATIYSPAPDYKFKNNTAHYILFEAVMDESIQELRFNFWGTNDGRRGWYDPPVVEQWFGAGETRTIETTDIPTGTTQCQSAHPGANTSFTYHVQSADGMITDRIFTSSYRSLPRVCLVGVEPIVEGSPEQMPSLSEEEPIPTSDL